MNAFDKVIGYDTVKRELLRICDMVKNPKIYEKMGAKLPSGILLCGVPGLGKTLMAKCFIEESGLPAHIVRRNKNAENFIDEITEAFRKAKSCAPSVVVLDDMDKFANEDDTHRDAEEYVAVQAAIDEVSGSDVVVLATVNDRSKLPDSLTRAGRFDKIIRIQKPTLTDAEQIIRYYLRGKQLSEDVNIDDLTKMISYSTCAVLESILNEAAMDAAYARKDCIEMADLVRAVLRVEYKSIDDDATAKDIEETALHEAGHLVACEVLCAGSVGFASVQFSDTGLIDGVVRRCKKLPRRAYKIISSLAGKAAVELYYSETAASGCQADIRSAFGNIRQAISESATNGFGMVDVSTNRFSEASESMNARNEAVTQAELERYYFKAKDILLKNRVFLEKVAEALTERKTLLYSDIQKLREEAGVTEIAV